MDAYIPRQGAANGDNNLLMAHLIGTARDRYWIRDSWRLQDATSDLDLYSAVTYILAERPIDAPVPNNVTLGFDALPGEGEEQVLNRYFRSVSIAHFRTYETFQEELARMNGMANEPGSFNLVWGGVALSLDGFTIFYRIRGMDLLPQPLCVDNWAADHVVWECVHAPTPCVASTAAWFGVPVEEPYTIEGLISALVTSGGYDRVEIVSPTTLLPPRRVVTRAPAVAYTLAKQNYVALSAELVTGAGPFAQTTAVLMMDRQFAHVAPAALTLDRCLKPRPHTYVTYPLCDTVERYDPITPEAVTKPVFTANGRKTKWWKRVSLADWRDLRSAEGAAMDLDTVTREAFVVFDYETVPDPRNKFLSMPYMVSFVVVPVEVQNPLRWPDGDALERMTVVYDGPECGHRMLSDLYKIHQRYRRLTMVAFNGSSFDNFLLLHDLVAWTRAHAQHPGIHRSVFSANRILEMSFWNVTLFDLRLHLVGGSLAHFCDAFGVTHRKGALDHNEVEDKFREHGWEFLNVDPQWTRRVIEYSRRDTVCLTLLLNAWMRVNGYQSTKLPMTIGKSAVDRWKDHLKKVFAPQKPLPVFNVFGALDEEVWTLCRESLTAGRVQLATGPTVYHGRMKSLDVCSLYPFSYLVANHQWGLGELTRVAVRNPDKVGIYHVTVDQRNLVAAGKHLIVPVKYRHPTTGVVLKNIWAPVDHPDGPAAWDGVVRDVMLGSLLIELCLEYGCGVDVHWGLEFEDSTSGVNLFTPFARDMAAKNLQDQLKRTRDEAYNPAERESRKLTLNSMSGKLLQRIHVNGVQIIRSEVEMAKLQATPGVTEILPIATLDSLAFAEVHKTLSSLIHKQGPLLHGLRVYDIARWYMYKFLLSNPLCRWFYTDTDSVKVRDDHMTARLLEQLNTVTIPHHPDIEAYDARYVGGHPLYVRGGKVFGSLEDEYEGYAPPDGFIPTYIQAERKTYCYRYGPEPHQISLSAKGIRRRDVWVTRELGEAIWEQLKNKRTWSAAQDVCRDHYLTHADANALHTADQWMSRLVRGETTFFVCQGSRRIMHNPKAKRATWDDPSTHLSDFGTVQFTYLIKRVRLNSTRGLLVEASTS